MAFASHPTVRILLGTLRCVWSEKTTVCRIFNCQRYLGAAPRTPRGRSLGHRPRSASTGSSLSLTAWRAHFAHRNLSFYASFSPDASPTIRKSLNRPNPELATLAFVSDEQARAWWRIPG